MKAAGANYGSNPFLSGGGAMGALIRAHPWAETPLGSPDSWPQSLLSILSLCLNSLVPAAVLWGPELRMLYNDAHIETLGSRHPSALGQPVSEVWDHSWSALSESFLAVVELGKGFTNRDLPISLIREGEIQTSYWDISAAPIRGEDGQIIGLLSQGFETTERVLADQAKREIAESLQRALSAGDGVGTWDWDVVADRVKSDAHFARLYGVPTESAKLGVPIAEFFGRIYADDVATLEAQITQALATGDVFTAEYRLVDADGSERWLLAQGRCELSADGTPVRFPGVSFDITRRKRLEEELSRVNSDLERRVEERTLELVNAQEALRQAQKMEAVGQLTGGIAHDFNNLIQGITGSLQIATRRLHQRRYQGLESFMADAVTSANRAASLTHRLLAFARRQPLDPRLVGVNDLIISLEDLITRTVGESIDLKVILDPNLWNTLCDPNQLESSLLNLVINARDAMAGKGTLTIQTKNVPSNNLPPGLSNYDLGQDYISICVTDTGSGMSSATRERAFEPFFTTKPLGHGTGLGLSMVYGFVRQSAGHIEINSTIDEGSAVTLLMPRNCGLTKLPPSSSAPGGAIRSADSGAVILVVEDQAVIRRLVIATLADLGYEAIEAEDGLKGLEVLQSKRSIDLLITDIGLPGLDGRDLAEKAREFRPALKVLIMTGYSDKAAQVSGFLGDNMALITKPFQIEDLAVSVKKILNPP